MRHRVHHRKLGRVTSHRLATLKNMAAALFEYERIRTTLMKAKELRPFAEKLITLAKRDGDRLHARRLVLRDIHDPEVLKKLFDVLGARYAQRAGGYTRIMRLGPRKGDGAEMAMVELVGSEYQPGKKDDKGAAAADKTEKAPEKPKAERASKAPKTPKAPKAEGEAGAKKAGRKKAEKPAAQ
jgi:large subunit ribosomal protein L17